MMKFNFAVIDHWLVICMTLIPWRPVLLYPRCALWKTDMKALPNFQQSVRNWPETVQNLKDPIKVEK